MDSSSELNVMIQAYAKQLALQIWQTNVRAQKINCLSLETFEIVIVGFEVVDKLARSWFL